MTMYPTRSSTVVSLLLTTIILINNVDSSIDNSEHTKEEFEKDFLRQANKSDTAKHKLLAHFIKSHQQCENSRWACVRACRAQILPTPSGFCVEPQPEDFCYGVPITHHYVKHPEPFPAHLEVLKKFPKCWEVLGPMLCAIFYRPCGQFEYMDHMTTKPESVELWQRYPVGMCTRTRTACADAIRAGVYPIEFIQCNKTVETEKRLVTMQTTAAEYAEEDEHPDDYERRVPFTSSPDCKVLYSESPSVLPRHQCMFPLVHADHADFKPIVDQCYMPCRSPLITSHTVYDSFNYFRAVVAGLLAIVFLSTFCYLFFASAIYTTELTVFAISHSFLSIGLYCLLWMIGAIGPIAKLSECVNASNVWLRRPVSLAQSFEWCVIVSFLIHWSFLSSVAWISATYAFSAAPLVRPFDWTKAGISKSHTVNLRPLSISIVYSICAAIGILGVFLSLKDTDGVSGVCSIGLHSIYDYSLIIILPSIIFILLAAYSGWRAKQTELEYSKKKAQSLLTSRISEAEDEARRQKRIDILKEQGVSETEISEEQKEDVMIVDQSAKLLQDDRRAEIERAVREDEARSLRENRKMMWRDGLGERWTGIALALSTCCLLGGVGAHAAFLWRNGDAEREAVEDYMGCIVNNTFLTLDISWIDKADEPWMDDHGSEGGLTVSDPLERRARLHSNISPLYCSLPDWGNSRLSAILLVFIVLPIVPFLVYLIAFFSGLAGYCGLRKAKVIRKSADDDFEKGQLIELPEIIKPSSDTGTCADDERSGSMMTERVPVIQRNANAAASCSDTLSVRGTLNRFQSTEITEEFRATSPVPSNTRSEIPPKRRAVSTPHVRKMNLLKHQENKRRLRAEARASSTETLQRRPRESGQLAPRRSIDRVTMNMRQAPPDVHHFSDDSSTSSNSFFRMSASQRGNENEGSTIGDSAANGGRMQLQAGVVGMDPVISAQIGMAVPCAAGMFDEWRNKNVDQRIIDLGNRIGELTTSLEVAISRLHESSFESYEDSILLRRSSNLISTIHSLVLDLAQTTPAVAAIVDQQLNQVMRESADLATELEQRLSERAANYADLIANTTPEQAAYIQSTINQHFAGQQRQPAATNGVQSIPSQDNRYVHPHPSMTGPAPQAGMSGFQAHFLQNGPSPQPLDPVSARGPPVYPPVQVIDVRERPPGVSSPQSDVTSTLSSFPSSALSSDTYRRPAPVPSVGTGMGHATVVPRPAFGRPFVPSLAERQHLLRGVQSQQPQPAYARQSAHFPAPTSSVVGGHVGGSENPLSSETSQDESVDPRCEMSRLNRRRSSGSSSTYSRERQDTTVWLLDKMNNPTMPKEVNDQEQQVPPQTTTTTPTVGTNVNGQRWKNDPCESSSTDGSSGYGSRVNGFGGSAVVSGGTTNPVAERMAEVQRRVEEEGGEGQAGGSNGVVQQMGMNSTPVVGPSTSQLLRTPPKTSPPASFENQNSPSLSRASTPHSSDSWASRLTPEEQARLVASLRAALNSTDTSSMNEEDRLLVEHLRGALSAQGGISRDEIIRWRLQQLAYERRNRPPPSLYAVSTVIISRLSLRELEVRVAAIRRAARGQLYPLEIYYALVIADVMWPLSGERDILMGDNVYSHDEINEILGSFVPSTVMDPENHHQLCRKRAFTMGTTIGADYSRASAEGEEMGSYQPPRLPDLDTDAIGGAAAMIAAIQGDLAPIREALQRIPLLPPDVMRLDNESQNALGAQLRNFRDYLDAAATRAGYPVRGDAYIHDDVPDPEAPAPPCPSASSRMLEDIMSTPAHASVRSAQPRRRQAPPRQRSQSPSNDDPPRGDENGRDESPPPPGV